MTEIDVSCFVCLLERSFQPAVWRFAALPPIGFHRFGDSSTQAKFVLFVFQWIPELKQQVPFLFHSGILDPFSSIQGKSVHFCVSPYLPITFFHSLTPHPFISDLTKLASQREAWKSDPELDWRKSWNHRFGLRPNCPYFRDSNSLFSPTQNIAGDASSIHSLLFIPSVLCNPHKAMPIVEPSWLISGNILYFHYGHQGLNDKGWGCAYRSLQCLLSFFSLNHYVDMRVPSIPEVLIEWRVRE